MKKQKDHAEARADYGIRTADGRPFDIPEKGSIGLLALGYRGLMAWRAKRIQADKAGKGPGKKK